MKNIVTYLKNAAIATAYITAFSLMAALIGMSVMSNLGWRW